MIMDNKPHKSKKLNIIIIGVLFISLIMNMILSINNNKYKFRVGKESYNSTMNVMLLNDKNNEILKNAIAQGSINNMDLLSLYKNYANISDDMTKLWVEYSYYKEDKSFLKSVKSINSENIVLNEVHGRIEEYLNAMLEKEMVTQLFKVNLNGEYSEKFQAMKDLSDRIKKYYDKFNQDNLNGLEYDDKTEKIIKEYYWVDMLEGINYINLEFINTNFIMQK